jgi:hypothetical protein
MFDAPSPARRILWIAKSSCSSAAVGNALTVGDVSKKLNIWNSSVTTTTWALRL